MVIQSKLTKQDFISLNFFLLYSKTSIKVFSAVTALLFLVSVAGLIGSKHDYSLPAILSFAFLFSMPLHTYINAVRNFKASSRVAETITYQFDHEYLLVKGESFSSQQSWDKIFKVTQTEKWILIWQNKYVGTPIQKGNLSAGQMEELKNVLDNHHVKNNL